MNVDLFAARWECFRAGGDVGCCAYYIVPNDLSAEMRADAESIGMSIEAFEAGQRSDCATSGYVVSE